MDQLTVYADPKTPNERVYGVDEKTSEEAFFDMFNSFRGAAFKHDLGAEAPGEKPKHNIPAQLQSINGVGQIMFVSPNYTVFKREEASWEAINPQIIEVFTQAFGEIKEVIVIEGSLA